MRIGSNASATLDIMIKSVMKLVPSIVSWRSQRDRVWHRACTSVSLHLLCERTVATVTASFKAQPHSHSHRRITVKTYVPLGSLDDVPALLLCERCLKKERVAALRNELEDAALSGDEVDE